MTDWPPPQDGKPMLTRDDYPDTFDSKAYLSAFYSKIDNEPAMKLVLSQLPAAVERVSRTLCTKDGSAGGRLLDVGSGPTIHVACAFREKMREIYLSDYLAQNRDELNRWLRNDGPFDWGNILHFLALMEGQSEERPGVEEEARSKVAGILPCDIFQTTVIPVHVRADFDVVTTFFCIEYATVDSQEYRRAVRNVVGLIKPGGYLIMGGVMNSTWCSFGGKKYTCFTLTEDEMFGALRENGIDVENGETMRYYNYDDM
jgi:nicotinamide N-methyltransferase